MRRGSFQRLQQPVQCLEIQGAVTPIQAAHWGKAMPFYRIYQLLFKRAAAFGGAKCPIGGMATGASGDLGNFSRHQMAHRPPVKFNIIGQRHMADIHIQPHADSIGGDHKIHIAILKQLYLGVTGTRRQRPHHHRCAAALPAHQFCQPVNLGS